VAVPWTGALRPRAGAAEVGWLRTIGGGLVVRAARASADNAALHGIAAEVRAPSRAAAAGLALTEGISDGLILAAALPSDQLVGPAQVEAPRAEALAQAAGELLERLGGGDLAGAASALGQLFGGPALAPAVGQLPPALMPTVARLSAAAGG
jgi:hypothetical protein